MARPSRPCSNAGRGEQIDAISRLLAIKGDPLGAAGWPLLPDRLGSARTHPPHAGPSTALMKLPSHPSWEEDPAIDLRPDLRRAIRSPDQPGRRHPPFASVLGTPAIDGSRYDGVPWTKPLLDNPENALAVIGSVPQAMAEGPKALSRLLGRSRIPEPIRIGLCRLAVALAQDEQLLDAVATRLPRPLGLYLLRAWHWSVTLPPASRSGQGLERLKRDVIALARRRTSACTR